VLAKVDTDANPSISRAFGIQGIPAVKAFRDGEVVDEFVGAQPPAVVGRFFDGLVPSEADQLVAAGGEAELRRALELEPTRHEAAVSLARTLHARGEVQEAEALLEGRPGFAAEGLAARLRLESDPALAPAFEALDVDVERGLDQLIAALAEAGDADRRDDLRKAVVGVLDGLGVDHPVARESRRKLAAALY
jgi:putative thioredoxin